MGRSLKSKLGITRKGVIVKSFAKMTNLRKFQNKLIFDKNKKEFHVLRDRKKFVLVAE